MKLLHLKLKKLPKRPRKSVKVKRVDEDIADWLVPNEDAADPEFSPYLAKETDIPKRKDLDPTNPYYDTRALEAVPSGLFGLWPHATELGVVVDQYGEPVITAMAAVATVRR